MSEARSQAWSLPEFLRWEERQERRYEFVGGRAVMTAGGTRAHVLIAANLIALLRPMLRGSPCLPFGSDLRVPIPATGNCRYPDVTIDCGPFDPNAHGASEPTVLFEVLAKSTGWYDQTQKVRDYDSVASIRQYVCISQSEPRVSLWLRGSDGKLMAQNDTVDMRAVLKVEGAPEDLRLVDIYEGIGPSDIPAQDGNASAI